MNAQFIPAGGVDRIPAFDPRSGEHYWIFPVAFRVRDPAKMHEKGAGPMLFDAENLVYAQGLGCYHCEEPYSPRLARRRCPGEP